jgi:hypothetical protein
LIDVLRFNAGALLPAEKLERFRRVNLYRDQEAQDFNLEYGDRVDAAVFTSELAIQASEQAETAAQQAESSAQQAETAAQQAGEGVAQAQQDAQSALNQSSQALTTANAANTKASQAIDAVSAVLPFTQVPDVSNLPSSPGNEEIVEVLNSTAIQTVPSVTGLPPGFVGDNGLAVKIQWNAGTGEWQYLSYFPNDPESRYAPLPLPDATTGEKGVVQLSTSVGSTSTTLAATASAVKTAYDRGSSALTAAGNAQTTADSATATATEALNTAGEAELGLLGKVDIGDKATQAQAEAGTSTTTWMTPLAVAQFSAANPGGVPVRGKASAYTLQAADNGYCISTSASVTVPSSLVAGTTISIWNNSGASISIIQGDGTTLYVAGAAEAVGNRTLESRGLATVQYMATGIAVVVGAGLS